MERTSPSFSFNNKNKRKHFYSTADFPSFNGKKLTDIEKAELINHVFIQKGLL